MTDWPCDFFADEHPGFVTLAEVGWILDTATAVVAPHNGEHDQELCATCKLRDQLREFAARHPEVVTE